MEDRLRAFSRYLLPYTAEAAFLPAQAKYHLAVFLPVLYIRIIIGKFCRVLIISAVALHTDCCDHRDSYYGKVQNRADNIKDCRAEQDQPIYSDLPPDHRDYLQSRQIQEIPCAFQSQAVCPEI